MSRLERMDSTLPASVSATGTVVAVDPWKRGGAAPVYVSEGVFTGDGMRCDAGCSVAATGARVASTTRTLALSTTLAAATDSLSPASSPDTMDGVSLSERGLAPGFWNTSVAVPSGAEYGFATSYAAAAGAAAGADVDGGASVSSSDVVRDVRSVRPCSSDDGAAGGAGGAAAACGASPPRMTSPARTPEVGAADGVGSATGCGTDGASDMSVTDCGDDACDKTPSGSRRTLRPARSDDDCAGAAG
jgi:hypothetical protein